MKILMTAVACLAIAMATKGAQAQAPLREGAARAGNAAAGAADRAVQGVRNVGDAAIGVTQRAAEATRNAAAGTARAVRGGVDRLTPAIPLQARQRSQITDDGRNARWRFQRHNGEWWYFSPENNWKYRRDGEWRDFAADEYQPPQQLDSQNRQQLADREAGAASDYTGQHTTGYRGESQTAAAQDNPQLHVDRCGRHYICQNGQRVYVSLTQNDASRREAAHSGQWSQPTPAEPSPPANDEAPSLSESETASESAQAEATSERAAAPDGEQAAASDESGSQGASDQRAADAPASPQEPGNTADPASEGGDAASETSNAQK